MKRVYNLPENFKMGCSASAFQTEGWSGKKEGQEHFVDMMYKFAPERWHNGIGTAIGTDFFNRFREDIKLMKECGVQVYRTSVDWSRFLIDAENVIVDEDAAKYYEEVIDTLIENGIEPMICMEHWEIPKVLVEKYTGWGSKITKDLFVKYAEKLFERYGHKVKYWWTINEPIVVPEHCYLNGTMYPYIQNTKLAMQMNYNRALATAEIVKLYNEKKYDGKIGIILNPSPAYPRSKENPHDVKAARVAELFNFRLYTDPLINGAFAEDYIELLDKHNCLFEHTQEELDIIRENTIKIVGINYYQPIRVKAQQAAWNPEHPFHPDFYYEIFQMPGKRMNVSRGWEIYPRGIYDMCKTIQNEYQNIECWITENGMGVEGEENNKDENGVIQDDYRIEFMSEHLAWVIKAIEEGANCKGYMNWAFTDNVSPYNAFKNRYGIVEIDLNNNRDRRIKKSGYFFRKLVDEQKFEGPSLEPEFK